MQTARGSCLCGGVRFEVGSPSRVCAHCHCSQCRKAHAAPYVTWLRLPRDRFRWLTGSEAVVRYRSSDHGTRSFCGRCGSSLLCESSRTPGDLDVAYACLDEPADRHPQLHVFFDDRAEWVEVGDALPRLGGATGLEPPA